MTGSVRRFGPKRPGQGPTMNRPTPTNPRSVGRARPRRIVPGLAALVLGIGALGACSSDDDDTGAARPQEFCDAVDVYVEKLEGGDDVELANALEGSTDELTDHEQRVVSSYITALTSVSPNHSPEDHGIEEQTEAGFRRIVDERCGDDVLPEPEAAGSEDDTEPAETPGAPSGDEADTGGETDGDG